MAVWDELKVVLARLRDEQPGALQMYPDLDRDYDRQPPFMIQLAPWAVATAERLYRQFGDSVALMVGALGYPPGRQMGWRPVTDRPDDLLCPSEATVELDGPASVRSGHTLRHGLLLDNLTDHDFHIITNGRVTAVIVDPRSLEVVGGFAEMQNLPLIMFRVAPGQTERIPLLIGTASFRPDLGYAVPAGTWGIEATLTFGPHPGDSSSRRTPVLPLTVTEL